MTQGNRLRMSAPLILTGLLLTAAALPERPPAKAARARALALTAVAHTCPASPATAPEIGRASCRERVCYAV